MNPDYEPTEADVEAMRQRCRVWAIETYGSTEAAEPAVMALTGKIIDAMKGVPPELQHMALVTLLECQIRMSVQGSIHQ